MAFYDYNIKTRKGADFPLSDLKGKVVLVVNTATGCGFTPQYEGIEKLYEKYHDQGFEVLDFPCNQFGNQAPGSDEEIHQFCTARYKTQFEQMSKIDVNGENELPLYTWLKSQKGFEGFDADNKLTPVLEKMFDERMPGWRETNDIKWNFTKFLINRNGEVVARFEPTCSLEKVEAAVVELL